MSYTFSRREKVLLVVLALILVGIVWYVFVYRGTADELNRLDAQIAQTEATISTDTARLAQMQRMESEIEVRKAAGITPSMVPEYDNLQPLMAELSGILGAVDTYSLSFDKMGEPSGGFVKRGVRIDFSCGSYGAARAVVDALAHGTFSCVVDSVTLSDNAVRGRTSGSPVTGSVHVVFVERA